jgi:diaminopimelate decarboxylase
MQDSLKSQFSVSIPSYKDYAVAAATEFAKEFPNFDVELLIEPGSALVGDCMEFVARVETIKSVRQKTFATVLGSQKNISMSGVNPPIQVISLSENEKRYDNVDIVGYTCIEGDVLYRGYSGTLAEGDYVVFSNCGSYSLVMKPPFILPNFAVIDIDGDAVELIKQQESFDNVFCTFEF